MGSARGILVIISSPSGAGKSTLAKRLLEEFSDIEFSVSYTTRKPRENEVDGVHYHFVDDATFDAMVAADAFVEWAHVHGNRYGTSRAAVESALVGGTDVVFDVDYQGGRSLSQQFPDDALKIFILPPSLEELERRLRGRATDSEEVIQRRLAKALEEIEHYNEYAHRIVNEDLDAAYATLRALYIVRKRGDAAPEDARTRAARNDEARNMRHAAKLIQAARTSR